MPTSFKSPNSSPNLLIVLFRIISGKYLIIKTAQNIIVAITADNNILFVDVNSLIPWNKTKNIDTKSNGVKTVSPTWFINVEIIIVAK